MCRGRRPCGQGRQGDRSGRRRWGASSRRRRRRRRCRRRSAVFPSALLQLPLESLRGPLADRQIHIAEPRPHLIEDSGLETLREIQRVMAHRVRHDISPLNVCSAPQYILDNAHSLREREARPEVSHRKFREEAPADLNAKNGRTDHRDRKIRHGPINQPPELIHPSRQLRLHPGSGSPKRWIPIQNSRSGLLKSQDSPRSCCSGR